MGGASIRAHLTVVWAVAAAIAIAIFATYALLPASEFYHVSHEGLAGGASRALVYANFPVSLVGLAMIGVSLVLLRMRADRGRLQLMGIVGALLCLVTTLPGVVKQSDLDARPINLVPLVGVVIAIRLTVLALRAPGTERPFAWIWKDKLGIWVTAALAIVSLPWILADVGVYIGDIPGLGSIFYSKQIPEGDTLRAVHLGHHHGLDGLLFAFAAFALGRVTRYRGGSTLATVVSAYLGLMLSFGIANVANDAWLEQFVKRGWVEYEIPSFLNLDPTLEWGVVLIGAAVAWALLFRPEQSALTPGPSPAHRERGLGSAAPG